MSNPYKVDIPEEELPDSSNSYWQKYKKEIVYSAVTTGLLTGGVATAHWDEISQTLEGLL